MNYRPTPTTASDAQARAVTSRMFVPGTVAGLTESRTVGSFHRRATLCCGKNNCGCGVPEILRNGTMAGFLGNLGDDTVSFEPTTIPDNSAWIDPVFNDPLIPINLTAQPVFQTTNIPISNTLVTPPYTPVSPSQPLQLQPSNSTIPGTAASVASAASQLIRASAVPTTRALVPATALSPSLSTQISSALSAQSILPGVSNSVLMILAAGAALLFSSTGKRR